MRDAILAILLSLPAYQDRETTIDREIRLGLVAEAIEAAVTEVETERPRELAAMLVATGWWESRYARHVHEGRCRTRVGECDYGRARSPWQLHQSPMVPLDEWRAMRGADLESTRIAATAAARVLSAFRGRCGSVAGAIALYATGRSCRWSGAANRARMVTRIEKGLNDEAP